MQKKFFKPITAGSAMAMITITTFISYAIGLLRDRVIAVNFGTSAATDTYNAAFLIPDTLFVTFIAGALAAAFLPIFSEYLIKDKKEAYKIANTVLTAGTLLISALAILAFIFMHNLVPLLFPEVPLDAQKDIIGMTRLMLSSAIFFTISNSLGNILMSYKHFLSYSLSPIVYNLGIILGVIFLSEQLGIYSAAIGVIIGGFLHCLVRIFDTLSTDYKFKPQLDIKNPGFIRIIKLMIPRTIGLISWQINLYMFSVVGMKLMDGGLAAFNFARNIQSFAVSMIGISFATAIFPDLSISITNNDPEAYTSHVQKTSQRILFFTIPAMVGIIMLSRPLVELILAGGVFDESSIALTSLILFYFAISIPFESLTHILQRAFYAKQDTKTPMMVSIVSMFLMAFCTYTVASKYGIQWFPIGFTLGMAFQVLAMTFLGRKSFKSFKHKEFIMSLSKTFLASGLMAVVLLLTPQLADYVPEKISHILRIFIGGGTFFIVAFMLKSPELSSVKYVWQRIIRKS
ncbi:MAG: murein biosynthesis integral membrane protein MurJ [Candidatus Gracilibacteria bacterium]|jgi:putative peptidoglycan lipid II flippase